jgi:hypothetical protein
MKPNTSQADFESLLMSKIGSFPQLSFISMLMAILLMRDFLSRLVPLEDNPFRWNT